MATVFSIEHMCRSKAIDIINEPRFSTKECREELKGPNYLVGDGKSNTWNGRYFYNPENRSWKKHHEIKGTPKDRIAGQISFENEDEWRAWQKKRDQVNSKLCGGLGYKFSKPPELKLSGYAFNPYNLYRSGRPPLTFYDAHNPYHDDPNYPAFKDASGFYGYYHNELDFHENGGFRMYRRQPSAPCACKGSALMYERGKC